ncbi:unnamed protein product [Schistocephalus solidus]|uniref:Ran-binding protein 3-like n=1 Tax=Schistocephalus solidus TaxID=70667 RepID=A0A183S8A0_SCHSO|nr:unnamed protein product [Schistocephalus solidus]
MNQHLPVDGREEGDPRALDEPPPLPRKKTSCNVFPGNQPSPIPATVLRAEEQESKPEQSPKQPMVPLIPLPTGLSKAFFQELQKKLPQKVLSDTTEKNQLLTEPLPIKSSSSCTLSSEQDESSITESFSCSSLSSPQAS